MIFFFLIVFLFVDVEFMINAETQKTEVQIKDWNSLNLCFRLLQCLDQTEDKIKEWKLYEHI